MTATILDGRAIAEKIKASVAEKIQLRKKKNLPAPGLAVILVGNNHASETYVGHKKRACEQVGIISTVYRLPENTDQKALEKLIDNLNNDEKVHGILLQLPLPQQLNADELLEKINYKKDVDGFHPYNLGRLAQRRPLLRPCTPHGVMTLLQATGENLVGKNAVVVGASNIVGRPMALELLLAKCTVTVCHRFTHDLQHFIKDADILISATGHHDIIKSEWIKPGAIVIDVGFSRLSNGTITGDIDFNTAKTRAKWITPVPGGVGPMTVATLLQNTVMAAEIF
ncbi:MAG TPA: bifunctional methylenetetrahydrofolate dehydrogenase/methenyltetrahydrofolate cyclohydrolase FolD [Coxiellaceae bacterium]|nr:MAG: bifunctional methylenetetrahydrofolate dehydrogenase/methenyltetrahydrofolate cyclohydrolase [Gammaproteobacteria bacterium RIFCSPHIGHO2_12_FULL_36_30]HLB56204.1 bifunctional methylenetetrahydrofolate dehydrogenase/methenyltetrahydrofolate cyclohydrolase FolD [Coxiellaceae bacterium]